MTRPSPARSLPDPLPPDTGPPAPRSPEPRPVVVRPAPGPAAETPGPVGRPVCILASPKDRFQATQPFHALLAGSVEAQGMVVDEFTPRRCLMGRYDIVHLHHPEKFVTRSLGARDLARFGAFFSVLRAQRAKGARIVWTAHNEGPHEPGHPLLERLYWRLLLPLLDGVIYLSESSRAQLVRSKPRLSRIPGFVIPHGDFRTAYANGIDRATARQRLGYTGKERVLAFVGNIRAYKNVAALARAFVDLPDPDLRLLIAGHVHTAELAAEIGIVAARDPRIRLIDAFVDGDDMQLYLNAADLVVLPFRRILNSGSAILALSFDRPVLVPDLGSLRELQGLVGADWVQLFRGEISPDILRHALGRFLSQPRPPRAPLESLAWERIGEQTAAAYRAVL